MWIFTKTGFISVVAHDTDPILVRVRARTRQHLADTFPEAEIIDLADGEGDYDYDYRFHADVPRMKVALTVAEAIDNLDYTSHAKEAMAGDDNDFYEALLRTWYAMYAYQEQTDKREARS